MKRSTSRRQFLKQTALLGVGLWASRGSRQARGQSPNEKLNLAIIGAGGRGASDLRAVQSENIVALCDVDERRAAAAFEAFPNARRYHDFREMLEQQKDLDAVVVSTPDHVHAAAAVMAMRLGKHVYCEKPLAHSVHEARVMRQVAAETGVATQMGNQGHSNDGSRRVVELVRAGVLGPVREVHAWTDRPVDFWPQGIDCPVYREPVPKQLDWNLWLGPAPARAYNSAYLPFKWRGWWDFGTGALGDMACHVIDTAFWALDLEDPAAVEAESSYVNSETAPLWSKITYEFLARGDRPPVKLIWYDGGKKPPAELAHGEELGKNGSLLIGERGTMFLPDAYGSTYKLLPAGEFADVDSVGQDSLPRSPGHHQEWIQACKGGPAALSNFDYSARLTETVLLGNLALRLGRRLEWDAANMKVANAPEADQWIRREYRDGWTL